MVADVDIVNMALAAIGTQSTVTSINPSDGSTEANNAAILYTPVRQGLLRAVNWNFARKQANLNLLKSATDTNSTCPVPWQFEYAYPQDSLRLRFLLPPFTNTSTSSGTVIPAGVTLAPPWPVGVNIPFTVAVDTDSKNNNVRVILSNLQNAIAVYTADISDPALFDSGFVDAFVHMMASRLVIALSGNQGLSDRMMKTAQGYIDGARISDGDEGTQQQNRTPDWIRVRGHIPSGFGLGCGYGDGYSDYYPYYPWGAWW